MEAQRLVKLFHPLVDDYTMQVRSTIRLVTVTLVAICLHGLSTHAQETGDRSARARDLGVTGRTEINLVLNWFEELTARVPGP